MPLTRRLTLSATFFATAVVVCVIVGSAFLAKPFRSSESEITLVSSQSLNGSHFAQVKIRSSLHAKALAGIVQPHREGLQSIVDSIAPQQITDKAYIRRIRRSMLEMLGPEAHLIEIRVNTLPVPLRDPRLEDLIRRLPGTLGYTNRDEAGDK